MIERLQDRRRLLEALAIQKMVNGDSVLAEALAEPRQLLVASVVNNNQI